MSYLISFASSLNLFISAQEHFFKSGVMWVNQLDRWKLWDIKLSAPSTLHITLRNWIHQNIIIKAESTPSCCTVTPVFTPCCLQQKSSLPRSHVASKIIHSPTPQHLRTIWCLTMMTSTTPLIHTSHYCHPVADTDHWRRVRFGRTSAPPAVAILNIYLYSA